MPGPKPEPRAYRVRIFAPDSELMSSRTFVVILDFTPGHATANAERQLDRLLKTLAAQDKSAKVTGGHYLTVTEVDGSGTFTWFAS